MLIRIEMDGPLPGPARGKLVPKQDGQVEAKAAPQTTAAAGWSAKVPVSRRILRRIHFDRWERNTNSALRIVPSIGKIRSTKGKFQVAIPA
jgi:hypothetical protein